MEQSFFAVAVVLTAAVHFGFIGFLVSGGFVAWRWPWVIWAHIPVVAWGVGSEATGLSCPLTDIERWARTRAGMGPLPSDGFIAHYITGVLYPESAVDLVRVVVVTLVLFSWVVLAVSYANRRRMRRAGSRAP